MDIQLLLTLLAIVISAIFLIVGRKLYLRSQRLRRRLQMSAIFTNITHELLTPLTVISASVDNMRDEEPRFLHDYDVMQLNIQRMVRLLQQILETSKSEAGELKLLVSQGDVMHYVRQTAECLEPLLFKKKMNFTITCQPESMMGWIDTDKLDKIIYNLLSNAAKYSNENGDVSITARTNRNFDRIIIEVKDTGDGIPPKKMRTLFKRFTDGTYREHHTIGTGLGLALTNDLVHLHRGTIDCQSEQGKGTLFTVSLPINKEAFNPDQIDEEHKIDLNIPKNAIVDFNTVIPDVNDDVDNDETLAEDSYRLLVVEDNLELLMLMQQLLKKFYRVYIAQNGAEALNIIHKRKVDLIVSDVMMPEIDGYELTRIIKSDEAYSHLPIILLTAKTQEEDEQEAFRSGADEFLTKPFRLKDLKLRIDNIIENRKRTQTENAETGTEPAEEADRPPTPEEVFISRATSFVQAHIEDEDYDRNALAADMGISVSTLYNKLKATTGLNGSAFIRDIRMNEARQMAERNPKIRVSDLAYSVGFHDPHYFSTCFKKHFGIQPSEYMDSLQQKN